MAAEFTRIISDVHYGDRASQVRSLALLRPLLEGPTALILNGDTLETRPGPTPELAAAMHAEVLDFFPRHAPQVTFLTGNHDADFSPHHSLDLAGGAVFVTHGDIIYDDIVPWSIDAQLIRRRMVEEFSTLPVEHHHELGARLALFRRVAITIPQRHHSERDPLKYAVQFANDTVWPPSRAFRILKAWRQMPGLAAALLRRHRPRAKFILIGHTHRPGIWAQPEGVVVINTGSFTAPLGACAVDLSRDRLVVRRIERRRGEFYPGRALREFTLAET